MINERAIFCAWDRGVYYDVVQQDNYRLLDLPLPPSGVLDIGAHFGMFSWLAREQFPAAEVLAVEPVPTTYQRLQILAAEAQIRTLQAALGAGPLYLFPVGNACNHIVTCEAAGFTPAECQAGELLAVPAVRLSELAAMLADPSDLVIKIDVEGAERTLIGHAPSEAVIRQALQVSMELHALGLDCETYNLRPAFVMATITWLASFMTTHRLFLRFDGVNGLAILRRLDCFVRPPTAETP